MNQIDKFFERMTTDHGERVSAAIKIELASKGLSIVPNSLADDNTLRNAYLASFGINPGEKVSGPKDLLRLLDIAQNVVIFERVVSFIKSYSERTDAQR